MHPCIHAITPNTPITHLPISPPPHYSCWEYAGWLAGDSLLSTICRNSATFRVRKRRLFWKKIYPILENISF
jgi:hypothetical protein